MPPNLSPPKKPKKPPKNEPRSGTFLCPGLCPGAGAMAVGGHTDRHSTRRHTQIKNWASKPTPQPDLKARARACTPGNRKAEVRETLRSTRGHSLRPGSRLLNIEGGRTARYRHVNVPRHPQATYKTSKQRKPRAHRQRADEREARRAQKRGAYRGKEHRHTHRQSSRQPRPHPTASAPARSPRPGAACHAAHAHVMPRA